MAPVLHELLIFVQGIFKALRMSRSLWGGGLLVVIVEQGESHIALVDILLEREPLCVA